MFISGANSMVNQMSRRAYKSVADGPLHQEAHIADGIDRCEQIDDAGTEQNPGRERFNTDITAEEDGIAMDNKRQCQRTNEDNHGGDKVDSLGHATGV